MLKSALEYLIGLGNVEIQDIGGQAFSTQKLHHVTASVPDHIPVNSLSGLIEYIKSSFDGDKELMVHVVSPTEVQCFTTFNRDYQRNFMICAKAMIPQFRFDNWYDPENFNIKLQSCFVANEDRDIMLKVVGNIKEESVNTVGDDGVSQAVVAKTGVATVANVKVPNPVLLKPYRTFVEVDQPESDFIFRMKSGPSCALFEADGGAWKLEAMRNIKEFLAENLQEQVETQKVVIIA
ncbi:hypothetical protein GOP56_20015 [Brevibacillus sp. 7WMA2]|uniref:hypothetical protein n=1 Tax=Brevibacillus sp. 7WMA2 TaxID=2683193 RepID=UPI0013A75F08|nr:hypothetical protein [Brevibacillus sp. 7WMA2]QIC07653.1 hypothetical protein GOP56_20015 [Brevibacillus sp. 7WMA2]